MELAAKIKALKSARARFAKATDAILLGLPGQYGFANVSAFIREVEKAGAQLPNAAAPRRRRGVFRPGADSKIRFQVAVRVAGGESAIHMAVELGLPLRTVGGILDALEVRAARMRLATKNRRSQKDRQASHRSRGTSQR
jgi:hypothetical protein